MTTHSEKGSFTELYMGFRIHMRNGIYIAHPQYWSRDGQEAIVATDLESIRQEIRRWWYQVGN
jgi:hypothetical protein